MRATINEEKAIKECYIRLYDNSTPKADFEELVNNAKLDILGQKIIDYMSYEIDKDKMIIIIDNIIKEFKIKPKYRAELFKNSIHLGCSPKVKTL